MYSQIYLYNCFLTLMLFAISWSGLVMSRLVSIHSLFQMSSRGSPCVLGRAPGVAALYPVCCCSAPRPPLVSAVPRRLLHVYAVLIMSHSDHLCIYVSGMCTADICADLPSSIRASGICGLLHQALYSQMSKCWIGPSAHNFTCDITNSWQCLTCYCCFRRNPGSSSMVHRS